MNSTVTYVVCYNDEKQLSTLFLSSMNMLLGTCFNGGQGLNLLLIDSKKKKYKSAAQAYNEELKIHQRELGDILIFCHQDIAFDNNDFHTRVVTELTQNPDQIIGTAGMSKQGRVLSNLKYFVTKEYITRTQLMEKMEVESVDECCFAMTREIYKKIRFDEYACFHWHLYAVDFCYNAKRRFAIKCIVLPESIYHKLDSDEGLTTDCYFLNTMWRLIRKYHADFNVIYAPCYICSTNYLNSGLKLMKSLVKNILRK